LRGHLEAVGARTGCRELDLSRDGLFLVRHVLLVRLSRVDGGEQHQRSSPCWKTRPPLGSACSWSTLVAGNEQRRQGLGDGLLRGSKVVGGSSRIAGLLPFQASSGLSLSGVMGDFPSRSRHRSILRGRSLTGRWPRRCETTPVPEHSEHI